MATHTSTAITFTNRITVLINSPVHRLRRLVLLAGCLASLFLAAPAWAQGYGRVEETKTNMGTYHHFTRIGTPTVQVNVLGAVQATGIYELSEGSRLKQLLALTGGPSLGPRQKVNTRHVTIRIFKAGTGSSTPDYTGTLDQVITARPEADPLLGDGDTVMIDVIERQGFSWRDSISMISVLASVGLILERFIPR